MKDSGQLPSIKMPGVRMQQVMTGSWSIVTQCLLPQDCAPKHCSQEVSGQPEQAPKMHLHASTAGA